MVKTKREIAQSLSDAAFLLERIADDLDEAGGRGFAEDSRMQAESVRELRDAILEFDIADPEEEEEKA